MACPPCPQPYFFSLRQSHYDYAAELFLLALDLDRMPERIRSLLLNLISLRASM
jgi:hypothetical protein